MVEACFSAERQPPERAKCVSMDDLVSFRVGAGVHRRAAEVCSQLGLELQDVLRALLAKIVLEKAVPFSIGPEHRTPQPRAAEPVVREGKLWSVLRPQVSCETAQSLLARTAAELSMRLADAHEAEELDEALLGELSARRAEVLALRRSLDMEDPSSVENAVAACRALLASLR